MVKDKEHTNIGVASLIFGILSLILYIIGWFFYSFVDNRLYGMFSAVILSILAISIGYIAKKQGDSYGKYGMIIGGFVIIITVVIAILTTPTSVEFGYY
jgi:hypothetical protein